MGLHKMSRPNTCKEKIIFAVFREGIVNPVDVVLVEFKVTTVMQNISTLLSTGILVRVGINRTGAHIALSEEGLAAYHAILEKPDKGEIATTSAVRLAIKGREEFSPSSISGIIFGDIKVSKKQRNGVRYILCRMVKDGEVVKLEEGIYSATGTRTARVEQGLDYSKNFKNIQELYTILPGTLTKHVPLNERTENQILLDLVEED